MGENFRQKRLKPNRAAVLVFMDNVPNDTASGHRRTSIRERIVLPAAASTFEGSSDFAFEDQTAAFAQWRSNNRNILPAMAAYKSVTRCRRFLMTMLTDLRVQKA